MNQDSHLEVLPGLSIPLSRLTFHFSKSSGPGGQHVNKVASRVTVTFDIKNVPEFSARQKARLLTRLASRLNKQGVLQISSQSSRSQWINRQEVIGRLCELLALALEERPVRHRTKIPRRQRRRRLADKRHRGRLKQQRRKVDSRDS